MEVHITSEFQNNMSTEHDLPKIEIPSSIEINTQLDSSVILEPTYSNILIPPLDRFCRVCGNETEPKDLVSIFATRGLQLDIPKKISTHLQIQVLHDDGLPQHVCFSCICQLNICQQLVHVAQEADIKLRHIFQTIQRSKQNSTEILNENSFQPIELQLLKGPHADNLEMSPCSNKALQEMKLVLVENDHVEENKEESHQDFDEEVAVKLIESNEDNDDTNKSGKKQDMFLCDLCGKHFHQAANLRTHKRTHLADSLKKKHPCSLCTKSFRSKFFLSEHMNMHKGLRPYSCSDCDKKFHKRTQLRQHRKTHITDNQKVACEICGMKFSRRGNLTQHIKRHDEDRKYMCRVCKEEFTTLNMMLSHRRIHTQEDIKKRMVQGENKEDNVYTCEICDKVLFKKSSFMYHLRTHKEQADMEDEKWKCKLCGKLLATRASLNYHTKSQHSSERPWRCQFCAEGFMLKDLLLTHERIHTGEKPFTCSICSKAFRAPNNLAQHMLMHTENRKFQCPYCNKCFHRKGTLNVHTRTHTGERPFICDFCGRPFTQKNDMLKHQRTHGLQPQYSCEVCSLSFNFKKDLTKHKLLNHRDDLETEVVPLIFTSDNNVFGNITHIITEDGKKLLLSTVQSFEENNVVH